MVEKWWDSAIYLLYDDLISYYTFFTTIFAEIAFLWAFKIDVAGKYTIILLAAIVNVLIIAALKGIGVGNSERGESILKFMYVFVFVVLLLLAALIDVLMAFSFFGISFFVTWIMIAVRKFQKSFLDTTSSREIGYFRGTRTLKRMAIFILGTIEFLIPAIAFSYFNACIDMSIFLKILFPAIILLLGPFWAYIEEMWAMENIFELACGGS